MSHSGRGISNPAALCYMISILHQLYMMPLLREHILSLKQEDYLNSTLVSKVSLLWHTLYEDTGGDPIDCVPIWDAMYFHNAGADIFMQKDASEFSSDFLSKLLKELDIDTQACIYTKDMLCGQLVNKLSTEGDASTAKSVLEKTERFFTVSVPVHILEESINLERALLEFTKEEQIPFRWPDYGNASAAVRTAVPTVKTTRFQYLPKHLTFHLKRFKFDMKSMRKVKLHNRFEFPRILDMAPYMSASPGAGAVSVSVSDDTATAQGSTQGVPVAGPSTRYRLSGAVIHKGRSASSGHYYSLIRQRGGALTELDVVRPEQWLLFNDHEVSVFDLRDLETEAFGGPRHSQESGSRCSESVSSAASGASSIATGSSKPRATHTTTQHAQAQDNIHVHVCDSTGFALGAVDVPQLADNEQQNDAHLCSESTGDTSSVAVEAVYCQLEPCAESEDHMAECESQLGSESSAEYFSDEEDDYCSSCDSDSDSYGSDASGFHVPRSAFMLYYDRID